MPATPAGLTLTLHKAIAEIGPETWDACAGGDNPFVSYGFLSAVEDSQSATARTGWLPQHAVLRDGRGEVVGVAPMYAKAHSYGEYVFDHGWAHALERAGGAYYPKLQVAVPFSPVPGPRLLLRPGVPAAAMAAALVEACRGLGTSSVHATFCTEPEWQALGEAGWLQRIGVQYHWHNRDYGGFEDFLAALSSRKRKMLRRERREANGAGLDIVALRGPEITRAQWDAFFGFYRATVDRKWGSAYLTRRFFTLLAERLGERVVLMLALKGGEPVAGALNLLGADTLYGRNWGCRGDWPFLHFELCYYRAIEFAIAHGLARVEAGAQGEHKIERGYLPCPTWSAHWIAHAGLSRAVADFLVDERREKREQMAWQARFAPYRHQEDQGAPDD